MRLKLHILFAFLILTGVSAVAAQNVAEKPAAKPAEKKAKKADDKAPKNITAEQVGESVIFAYSALAGRDYLKQIRKTTIERGKITLTGGDGKTEQSNYERLVMRGDSLSKERVRFDQEYPNGRFALIYNNDKVVGLFNDQTFEPREEATRAFQNQMWHGIEALLRYKENESTLTLATSEKLMGVDYHVLDVTDKQNRKTRYFISQKTLRVMLLEYAQDNVKYRRRFYDYNYAQGTLVPFRTVLWANDKQIEETMIQTISFGQKVEEDLFKQS